MTRPVLAAVVFTLAIGPAASADSTFAIDLSCVVVKLDKVTIAAAREGLISRMLFREGDDVEQGDLLLEIDHDEADALLRVAAAKEQRARLAAENPWEIKIAEEDLRSAAKEDELLRSVPSAPFLERFRADSKRARGEAGVGAAKFALAIQNKSQQVAAAERRVAELDVSQRRVVATLTGSVSKQHKHQGDWASRGEPVMTVVRMDRLLLKAVVNVRDLAPHEVIGLEANAELNPHSATPIVLAGVRISKVSPEIDIDGNYVVWTEIENRRAPDANGDPRWLVRPGMTGRLTLGDTAKRRPGANLASRR